jgi:trans-2,3-dihydro-3-hydroxyanthranilate isomerase
VARRPYPYAVFDVFTDQALTGNQLAVVRDADDLDDERMAAFARETRLSETTFVQPATEDGADYRNRIFTVAGEIPFAGHPSLGTAVAVALAQGKREASYIQQTGAGHQPVDIRMENGHAWASMLQEPAEFGAEVDVHDVVAAIGLVIGEAHRELLPQVVSTGLPTLIAPVLKVACVSSAHPDFELIEDLSKKYDAPNLYVVCLQEEGKARARMFTNAVEGGEDPATGSAAGPFCAYLAERGRGNRVEISQGVEMRRPSRLFAEMHNGRPRVGGHVVKVIEGEVLL